MSYNKDLAVAITLSLLIIAINGVENGGLKADDDPVECQNSFIKVTQVTIGAMPSGTPIYSVQVLNESPIDCKIAQIHVNCGSFSSEKFILPNIFKRVDDNDCLVNNGQPINVGAVVSFQYANTQAFPLEVSSLLCLTS